MRWRPDSSVPFSSTVAPGFAVSGAFTLVTSGNWPHRAIEAASLAAICVAACDWPCLVGEIFSRASGAGSEARVRGSISSPNTDGHRCSPR